MKISPITTALVLLAGWLAACSKKIAPPAPAGSAVPEIIERVPASEIDIPVTINLQPLYAFAELYVDKEFSSEGWPDKWVYEGCNTRYMYQFKRGPLAITSRGNTVDLDFTGYYKVKGAQRGCIAGVGITPWSPPCTCGFNEAERRVQIGFSASFVVQPNYSIGCQIQIKPVKALDACEMCFFKTDITNIVINNIKPQLDTAKRMVERQLAAYNLRPRFEQVWGQLQQPYALAGYGHLYLQPEQLRLSSLNANGNQLQLVLGLRARPQVSLNPPAIAVKALPPLTGNLQPGGFNVYADARLNYDSLSNIINRQFGGTRIEMEKGALKNKNIVVDKIELGAKDGETLLVKAFISGSANGVIYLTGRPAYDTATATLRMNNLDFDIKTREFLVKTAAWMLNKQLTRRLREAAIIDLRPYVAPLKTRLNQQLNRSLTQGVTSSGSIAVIEMSTLLPQPGYLFVRVHASGLMRVQVSGISF